MGGGCCVSPHSLEGSRDRGAIGRHGAAPSGPSGDFGVPMWGQGLDPGVGHAGGGWGRTRSRPRWVLFPTGPGILGAKAKGVIKEGGGGTGPEGVRGRHHVPSHGRLFLGCLGTARSLPPPGPRSSGPPPSSPAGGACGVFASPCGVCGGGAGGVGGCGGAGGAAVPGATAWLTGGKERRRGGVREPPSPRLPPPPPDPTNVLCRAVWAGPTCRCCGI